jgi:hypothetical protein
VTACSVRLPRNSWLGPRADKNLRQHGLIQAYSRTNRILNSVKTYFVTGDTSEDWRIFVSVRRDAELDSLITEENLKAEETRQFI